jgi:Flp pilus assembly protein TadG
VRLRSGGNFLVLFAVSLTGMLAFGALVIDTALIRNVRLELQNAADAAAHAAIIELRRTGSTTSARDLAVSVALANYAGGQPVHLDSQDVTFGDWDFEGRTFTATSVTPNGVQVTTRRSARNEAGAVPLVLGAFLGMEHADVVARASAALRTRAVIVVQDVTGSFSQSIDSARTADVGFLDAMVAQDVPGDQLGMVTFTAAGSLWTSLQDLDDNHAAIRSQWYGDGVLTYNSRTRKYQTKTAGLTICYKAGQSAPYSSSYMIPCSSGGDGTAPGPGIQLAAETLIDETRPGTELVIVFVSDGKPECIGGSTSCAATRAEAGRQAAAFAAENGVNIFSVSFCNGCSASAQNAQFAYNRTLVTGYGEAYITPRASDLPVILNEIARAIPVALVQ